MSTGDNYKICSSLSSTIAHSSPKNTHIVNNSNVNLVINTSYNVLTHVNTTCVMNKLSPKTLFVLHDEKLTERQIQQKITDDNMQNLYIYKNTICDKRVCLIFCDIWYVLHDGMTESLCSDSTFIKLFNFIIGNKINYNELDKELCYMLMLCHSSFNQYGVSDDVITEIYGICSININTGAIVYDLPHTLNISSIKRLYFSCVDEMLTSLEKIDSNIITDKKIFDKGYSLVIVKNETINTYQINSDMYDTILSCMPEYTNKYWCYLELYQLNKLGDVLPYIHSYHYDIIKMINISIKTLSKEILNIYHLTRQHQHPELYAILTQTYKKVLYDLHDIYTTNKKNDYTYLSDEEYVKEKKAVTINIVYYYLKNIPSVMLRKLFADRLAILQNLKIIATILSREIIDDKTIDMCALTTLLQ
jgi:hypothetical protein